MFCTLLDFSEDNAPDCGNSIGIFLKEEVISFLRDLYEQGKVVKSINVFFWELTPKKEGAEVVRILTV